MYAVRVFPFRRSIPGGYHSYNPMKIYFKPNAKPDPMLIRFKMCWMDTFSRNWEAIFPSASVCGQSQRVTPHKMKQG